IQLHILNANDDHEFDAAFTTISERRVRGLTIGSDTYFLGHSQKLAALTTQHAVPTLSPYREFPLAVGLMSYGSDVADQYRHVGVYVGRILKEEQAGDL